MFIPCVPPSSHLSYKNTTNPFSKNYCPLPPSNKHATFPLPLCQPKQAEAAVTLLLPILQSSFPKHSAPSSCGKPYNPLSSRSNITPLVMLNFDTMGPPTSSPCKRIISPSLHLIVPFKRLPF